jgi:hypothetical protein
LEYQEIRAYGTPLSHVQIRAGQQILTAADPLPENLRDALAKTTSPDSAH